MIFNVTEHLKERKKSYLEKIKNVLNISAIFCKVRRLDRIDLIDELYLHSFK